MAVTAPPRAGCPPGPTAPRVVQALRYTYRFRELTAEQHARHGESWTLRLPGVPDAVVTADRELIRALLTGDPLTRRHAKDILAPAIGDGSILLPEPAPRADPPLPERTDVLALLLQTRDEDG